MTVVWLEVVMICQPAFGTDFGWVDNETEQ
jgi:hypothetical protein